MSVTIDPWLAEIAALIEKDSEPKSQHFISFLQDPSLCFELILRMQAIDEAAVDENHPYYSACIFGMDICVAQLQAALEAGQKTAAKVLEEFMQRLAKAINTSNHSLGFWLPLLNAFYDAHVELSYELQEAYFELAEEETEAVPLDAIAQQESIREMIAEMSDLSAFDIAENFFAQSHAMPSNFFADLMVDLFSIEEGGDIGLLMLLHPKFEVRAIVLDTMNELIDTITLSALSLTRLQRIKNWYPPQYHQQFDRWIKIQRKKGVIFHKIKPATLLELRATEVDGSGVQGIYMHLKEGKDHRVCGMLLKQKVGLKDVWMSPKVSFDEFKRNRNEALKERITLRPVGEEYLSLLVGHFLAQTIASGDIPDLHFLEIEECLGLHFQPEAIDITATMEALSIQIAPFTNETMQNSFKRSKAWLRNKAFTESWYIENPKVDKLVNRSSSFVQGVKVCDIETAQAAVLKQEMEKNRQSWLFHFLWISLWLKAKARKNETLWQDSFIIAYAIQNQVPLQAIPVMCEIARQSILNSVETMLERRTHLTQE